MFDPAQHPSHQPDASADTGASGALRELRRAAESLRGASGAASESIRMRRFWQVSLMTTCVFVILLGFVAADWLPWPAFTIAVWFAAMTLIGLFVVLRWQRREPLHETSLTLGLTLAAIVIIFFVMASATGGHAILMALYVVALAFSPLRLQLKELAGLAAFVLLGDLAILAFTWDARLATSSPLVEALRWSALACVLGLTVWAGSLLAALRERVQRSNTGLSHAIETIRHMVTHDELTGVYNRRHLVEVLKAECARSDRYESQWTLCLLDLDFFKRVNDTLGHSGGDLVLRGFAQTIQKAKRPTDTFGRYGGEEFMLILAQTSLESGLRGAERMRALIEATRYEGLGPEFGVSVSIGVAQYRHGEDWQTTIARADRALYRAKQSGRNRVEPEDPPPPDPGQSVRAVARDRREKELLAEPS